MNLNVTEYRKIIIDIPHKPDVHNCNTSTQETETGGSRVESHVLRSCLKQANNEKKIPDDKKF